jgi:hypothetical protein
MGVVIGDLVVTDSGIIEAGNYTAGAVLGKVTATGVLKLSATKDDAGNAITDGSEKPYAILLEDVVTDVQKSVPILLLGEVDKNQLSFGEGWDLESVVRALRDISIFAKGVVNG